MDQLRHSPSKRYGILDLLRFFAVLFIFFGHYTDTFNYIYGIVPANQKWNIISRYASLALFIFFLISGYVVTMTSVNRNFRDFLIIRFSRIYPLFWLSCLTAFILPRLLNHSFLPIAPFKTFLLNLTLVPTLFNYPFINPVFHTLFTEIMFYIFLSFIILLKLWSKVIWILTFILACCFANAFHDTVPLHANLIPLTAGMLFYFIQVNDAKRWKLYSLLALNFSCALLLAPALAQNLNKMYTEPDTVSSGVILCCIVLIYALFLLMALKKITLKSRPSFIVLSEISYAFYLFHIYFLVFYYHFRNTIQEDILLLLLLVIILCVSWIIHTKVEKPLSAMMSRILYQLTSTKIRHSKTS